jgi:hypothetical protein
MAKQRVKYSVEIEQDDNELLYASLYEHRQSGAPEVWTVELITSDRVPSISDAMFTMSHEIASFMGKEWL